jgi:hypothetical protein
MKVADVEPGGADTPGQTSFDSGDLRHVRCLTVSCKVRRWPPEEYCVPCPSNGVSWWLQYYGGPVKNDDGFGNRLVEAAARLDAEIKHAIRPPRLAWCGDGIAVVVPAERGVIWHIDLNGAVRALRATDDEAELPLSLPWPARIPWQRRGAGSPSADGHLSLAAAMHGGVTVFDVRTGRLAEQVSAEPTAPFRLASGHYVLVSSQQLHHDNDAGFDLVGGGFALDIVLETNDIRVRSGNHDVLLVPWQRPTIELCGKSFTDLKGAILHASHGLQALVRWPQEEAGVPHELVVEAGALTLRNSLPVRPGDDRTAQVDLGGLLESAPGSCG